MVEHATENRGVGSSILPLGTFQANSTEAYELRVESVGLFDRPPEDEPALLQRSSIHKSPSGSRPSQTCWASARFRTKSDAMS